MHYTPREERTTQELPPGAGIRGREGRTPSPQKFTFDDVDAEVEAEASDDEQ